MQGIHRNIKALNIWKALQNAIGTDLIRSEVTSDNAATTQNSASMSNVTKNNKHMRIGVQCFDKEKGMLSNMLSRGIAFASGGLFGLYEHSTNPTGFNALGSLASLALREMHKNWNMFNFIQRHCIDQAKYDFY